MGKMDAVSFPMVLVSIIHVFHENIPKVEKKLTKIYSSYFLMFIKIKEKIPCKNVIWTTFSV